MLPLTNEAAQFSYLSISHPERAAIAAVFSFSPKHENIDALVALRGMSP
jgi:hypothetical protein